MRYHERDEMVCSSGLENYYGTVELYRDRETGAAYLYLDDYGLSKRKDVSEAFATAFINEFAPKEEAL